MSGSMVSAMNLKVDSAAAARQLGRNSASGAVNWSQDMAIVELTWTNRYSFKITKKEEKT